MECQPDSCHVRFSHSRVCDHIRFQRNCPFRPSRHWNRPLYIAGGAARHRSRRSKPVICHQDRVSRYHRNILSVIAVRGRTPRSSCNRGNTQLVLCIAGVVKLFYSAWMLAALTTLAYFSISDLMRAPNVPGVPPAASRPWALNDSFIDGVLSVFRSARLSF